MSIDLGRMNAAETTEVVDRFGWVARELDQHFISHDAAAWHVPTSGLRFSPGSQFTKHRSPLGLECVPSSNSLIPLLRLPAFFSYCCFETRKFLTDPF